MSCLKYMSRRGRSKGFNTAPYFTLHREICEQPIGTISRINSRRLLHFVPEELLLALHLDLKAMGQVPVYLRLRTLDRISVSFNPDEDLYREGLRILLALQQKLQYNSHMRSDPDSVPEPSEVGQSVTLTRALLLLNGVEILQRIIMQSSLLPKETSHKHAENSRYLVLQSHCIEVLHRLCVDDADIAKELSANEELFHGLLSLLQFTETCIVTCDLLECLLLSRKDVLNLATIPNIGALIARLDNIQLANFCKVLAISLSDLDVYEHKTSLYAQCKEKNRNNFSCVRDVNQEVILNVPGILKRLVLIACAKPCEMTLRKTAALFDNFSCVHLLRLV